MSPPDALTQDIAAYQYCARHVDGGELRVRLLRGLQLVGVGQELVVGLRGRGDAGLLVQVGAVDQHPGARVVGHAVGLALEVTGALEALQPGARVLVVGRVDRRERLREHVLGELGVAQLDHVRHVGAGQRGVELGQVVGPLLVLDVDLGAGGVGEPLGRVVDDVLPAALRVDHQPDLEGLALAVNRSGSGRRGGFIVVGAAGGGAEQRSGDGRGCHDLALHASSRGELSESD